MNALQAVEADCGQKANPVNNEWQVVARPLDEIRPHRSYTRHRLTVSASQLFKLASLGDQAFQQPIVTTAEGTIIDGYARLQLARQQGRKTILCIQRDFSEEQALNCVIQAHRPSRGLNPFNRVLLALDLELSLQETARANQQWGGRNKGSSTLTKAEVVDVRSKIAAVAGVSQGSVAKVRKVAKFAHPVIQDAAKAGEISIHRAWQWSCLPPREQLTELEPIEFIWPV